MTRRTIFVLVLLGIITGACFSKPRSLNCDWYPVAIVCEQTHKWGYVHEDDWNAVKAQAVACATMVDVYVHLDELWCSGSVWVIVPAIDPTPLRADCVVGPVGIDPCQILEAGSGCSIDDPCGD